MKSNVGHAAPQFISTDYIPKVLLLGNGPNRVYGGTSWMDALQAVNRTSFDLHHLDLSVPYPLLAVLATDDHVDEAARELHNRFLHSSIHPELRSLLVHLASLDFDCIVTLNYSYEMEMALYGDLTSSKNMARDLKQYIRHTSGVRHPESDYMIHTFYELPWGDQQMEQIWHVHGEARLPNSMIFGHYFYGNLLGRIQDYLDGRRDHYRQAQRQNQPFEIQSWIDYFLLGDVYALGAGFDPSEMDLWWLLNRKKRTEARHGAFHFYEAAPARPDLRHQLLDAYGAHIHTCGMVLPPQISEFDFKKFYQVAANQIASDLSYDRVIECSMSTVEGAI